MVRKLNLGCGKDIRPAAEGWVNMDIAPLPGVDVVHDLLEFPWPFEDASVDHVFASHVMEHVPHFVPAFPRKNGFLVVMEELHRILRPGGTVEIVSPHHESADRWADPTHTRVIHPRNFAYFAPDGQFDYYSSARFEVVSTRVEGLTTSANHWFLMGKSQIGLYEHLVARLPFLRWLLVRKPQCIRIVIRKPAT